MTSEQSGGYEAVGGTNTGGVEGRLEETTDEIKQWFGLMQQLW
jgi:hypothetical protein